jgi:enoyl-CoA hydratase/carnithine racemase
MNFESKGKKFKSLKTSIKSDFGKGNTMSHQNKSSWEFPSNDRPLVHLGLMESSQILVLRLQNTSTDNWFTLEFIGAIDSALNQCLKLGLSQVSLITIGNNPKIYSNGLYLNEAFEKGQPYFDKYMKLVQRMLVFPMPTIAALNGHAYAGGCV